MPRSKAATPVAPQPAYKLFFVPAALAEWHALDGSVKAVLKPLLAKRLQQPHVPGGALSGELLGCYKIKLLKQGVRLIYHVDGNRIVVTVLAVDKRANDAVYRSALARFLTGASAGPADTATAAKAESAGLKEKGPKRPKNKRN